MGTATVPMARLHAHCTCGSSWTAALPEAPEGMVWKLRHDDARGIWLAWPGRPS